MKKTLALCCALIALSCYSVSLSYERLEEPASDGAMRVSLED